MEHFEQFQKLRHKYDIGHFCIHVNLDRSLMAILFAYSRQHLQLCLQQARYLKFPSSDGLSMTTAPMEEFSKPYLIFPKFKS